MVKGRMWKTVIIIVSGFILMLLCYWFLFNSSQHTVQDNLQFVQTSLEETATAQYALLENEQATAVAEFEKTRSAFEATSEAAEETREAEFEIYLIMDDEACTNHTDYNFEVGRLTFEPRLGTAYTQENVQNHTIRVRWGIINEGCPVKNVRLVSSQGKEFIPVFTSAEGNVQSNVILEGESVQMSINFDSIDEANSINEELRFVVEDANGRDLQLNHVKPIKLKVPDGEEWIVIVTPQPSPTRITVEENIPQIVDTSCVQGGHGFVNGRFRWAGELGTNQWFAIRIAPQGQSPQNTGTYVKNMITSEGRSGNNWTLTGFNTGLPPGDYSWTVALLESGTPIAFAPQTGCFSNAGASSDSSYPGLDSEATQTRQASISANVATQTHQAQNQKATADTFNAARATQTRQAQINTADTTATRKAQDAIATVNAQPSPTKTPTSTPYVINMDKEIADGKVGEVVLRWPEEIEPDTNDSVLLQAKVLLEIASLEITSLDFVPQQPLEVNVYESVIEGQDWNEVTNDLLLTEQMSAKLSSSMFKIKPSGLITEEVNLSQPKFTTWKWEIIAPDRVGTHQLTLDLFNKNGDLIWVYDLEVPVKTSTPEPIINAESVMYSSSFLVSLADSPTLIPTLTPTSTPTLVPISTPTPPNTWDKIGFASELSDILGGIVALGTVLVSGWGVWKRYTKHESSFELGQLTTKELKYVTKAFISAFPTSDKLIQMLDKYDMDIKLKSINDYKNYQGMVMDLLQKTEGEGLTDYLIEAALDENNDNADLQGVATLLGVSE